MRALSAGVITLTIAASGCSTVAVQRDRFDGIRTVALAGFTLEVESGFSEEGEIYDPESRTWRPKERMQLSARDLAERREIEKIHAELQERLEQGLGWRVVPERKVAETAAYGDLLRFQIGKTWQPPEYRNSTAYGLPMLLHFHQATDLTQEERKRILEQTDADALIAVRIVLRVDKTDAFSISNLLGVGAYFPTAVSEAVVHDGTAEDPVWVERGAESDSDVDGTFQIGGEGSDEVFLEKALLAIQSSLARAVERVRDQ